MKSIRSVYLVDCENVGRHNLAEVPDGSLVVYFTSNNTGRMEKLRSTDKLLEKECYRSGEKSKNAMDFVLVTVLGHLTLTYEKGVRYIVVSKDHGFDSACRFLADEEFDVKRLDGEIAIVAKECGDTTTVARMEHILSLLSKQNKKILDGFYTIWKNTTKAKSVKNRDAHLESKVRNHSGICKELKAEGKSDTIDFLLRAIKEYGMKEM